MINKILDEKVGNTVSNQEEVLEKTNGKSEVNQQNQELPQADKLKKQFKAGSIPLQTDFADLIDLANIGCKAVGQAKDQKGPADGFTLSSTGRLELVPEQTFQKGMVMMFAGSEDEMPKGWALCDGQDGRPDLQNRFVLGTTKFSDINKTNNQRVQGDADYRSFNASSDSQSPHIEIKVHGHALTKDEMPEHKHDIFTAGKDDQEHGTQAIYERSGISPSFKDSFSQSSGNGNKHEHDATADQVEHSHITNVVPPYYILAFIIKV